MLFRSGAGYVVEGLLSHCPAPVAVIPGRAPVPDEAEEGGARDDEDAAVAVAAEA